MAELKEIKVPDIGDVDAVEVIEVLVTAGDQVDIEAPLITLESDKASMDIPSPQAGSVKEVKVTVGQQVKEGDLIAVLEVSDSAGDGTEKTAEPPTATTASENEKTASPAPAAKPATPVPQTPRPTQAPVAPVNEATFSNAHASPGVRRFARELGADLGRINGSGPKGRILKADVQSFIKQALAGGAASGGGNAQVEPPPQVDFAAFGEIETQPLTKINKLTGKFLHSSWFYIPHVTQFDEADITDLEAFRKSLAAEYKDQGIKVTMVAFLLKAAVSALKEFPRFNSSLDASGENLVLKKYFHIGVAVNTDEGLVVPVIRDVDQKGILELAVEIIDIATRARQRKIKPTEMQGACFTISSLGGVGGTAFTPIINQPEVAILGVSRSSMKPIYQNGEFVPRLMLPLSLSYDHRVIDGVMAAQFTNYLSQVLSDSRRLLLK